MALIDVLRAKCPSVFGRERLPGDPLFYDPECEPSDTCAVSQLQGLGGRSEISADLMYAANKLGRIVTPTTAHLLTNDELEGWQDAIKEDASVAAHK